MTWIDICLSRNWSPNSTWKYKGIWFANHPGHLEGHTTTSILTGNGVWLGLGMVFSSRNSREFISLLKEHLLISNDFACWQLATPTPGNMKTFSAITHWLTYCWWRASCTTWDVKSHLSFLLVVLFEVVCFGDWNLCGPSFCKQISSDQSLRLWHEEIPGKLLGDLVANSLTESGPLPLLYRRVAELLTWHNAKKIQYTFGLLKIRTLQKR